MRFTTPSADNSPAAPRPRDHHLGQSPLHVVTPTAIGRSGPNSVSLGQCNRALIHVGETMRRLGATVPTWHRTGMSAPPRGSQPRQLNPLPPISERSRLC